MQYRVKKAMQLLIYLYVMVLFVMVPFYMPDKYSKLGRAKFELFRNNSVFFLGLLLFLLLVYLILQKRNIFQALSLPDKFVISYFLFTLVSFVLSTYQEEAFWGVGGWFMGLFSQMVFFFTYFFVSRFFSNEKYLLILAGLSTTVVFLFGILHRFLVDPLGVYQDLDESLQVQFLSTLGQATWYSSFLCVCFPIGIGIYWYAKKLEVKLLSGLYIAIAMASLVTQNSDSAFFALGAVLFVLFCLAFENREHMKRFVELCLIILFSFQIIGILQKIYWYRAVELERISIFMSQSVQLKILLVVLIFVYLVLWKYTNIDLEEWKFIRNAVVIVLIMAVIGTVIYIYCNTTDIFYYKYGYRNDANYLKFDDSWGNGRGSSWKLAWRVLGEMSWKDRLFGVGPDSFSFYAYDNPVYAQILQDKWGNSNLTNVHNEFLNSMICYGIFGVISYVGIFVTAFLRFMSKIWKGTSDFSPLLLGAALSAVAYVGHNFFCYQQVLCTPYLFIILGMGEAVIRKSEKK